VDGDRVRKTGRHLKVGTRTAGLSHDPDLQIIRVLARQADGSPPSTQFGTTYIRGRDDNFPNEPWSDFSFNTFNESSAGKDSTTWRYKQWPVNATASSQLAAGKYYFTAWSRDDNGNWSGAAPVEITVLKKGQDSADVISKTARLQTINSGTLSNSGFSSGELVQAARDAQRGIYLYGHQITNAIGQQGKPFIKNAQILVHRKNDSGAAMANVWLWWHDCPTTAEIPPVNGDLTRHQITLVGQIAKGESKWFKIPDTHIVNMENDNVKGFGLNNKNPDAATATAADYSVVKAQSENLRAGELYLVWTEKPGAS
jgi:hypothetical protein